MDPAIEMIGERDSEILDESWDNDAENCDGVRVVLLAGTEDGVIPRVFVDVFIGERRLSFKRIF